MVLKIPANNNHGIGSIGRKGIPRRMWLELEDFSSFKLNNTKIWAVLDCSFRTEDGGVTIIDWKTGRKMEAQIC